MTLFDVCRILTVGYNCFIVVRKKIKRFPREKGRGKVFWGSADKKVRVDKQMQKVFRKRARQYNSDDDEEEEEHEEPAGEEGENGSYADDKVKGDSDDEDENIEPGITMFTDGCKAFKMAFSTIIRKKVADPELGHVLSGNKELVAMKLAEVLSERKAKEEAKKDKHMEREKGHAKLPAHLDSQDKFLLNVDTKGASNFSDQVIYCGKSVSKAQNAQKGLNLSRDKDAKGISVVLTIDVSLVDIDDVAIFILHTS
ncbi:uncharacterized protein LOC113305486 [Papaver somniferum]|uniref:uncharacterized protein LOC113305486 n=1 Tax=Papaver somniferum TaxID=3469 RepID=UPI000E6FD743|nr:uncharacterized protein LOC113305486 [Papaver somniferum]